MTIDTRPVKLQEPGEEKERESRSACAATGRGGRRRREVATSRSARVCVASLDLRSVGAETLDTRAMREHIPALRARFVTRTPVPASLGSLPSLDSRFKSTTQDKVKRGKALEEGRVV